MTSLLLNGVTFLGVVFTSVACSCSKVLLRLGGSLRSVAMGGLCGGFVPLPFCSSYARRGMIEFLEGPLC